MKYGIGPKSMSDSSKDNSSVYVNIILPLNLNMTYTYRVPREWEDRVCIGQRVVVPLGRKRLYSGLVESITTETPEFKSIRYILYILDEKPIISEKQLRFWKWISSYYMSSIGEVMIAALPSNLRLRSQTLIHVHPEFSGDISNLDDNEVEILNLVMDSSKGISIEEIEKKLNKKNLFTRVNDLITKNILVSQEKFRDTRKPKKETYIRLSEEYRNEEKLKELFAELESNARNEKQLNTLLTFLSKTEGRDSEVAKKELDIEAGFNPNSFTTLLKKNVFEVEDKLGSRLETRESKLSPDTILLNNEQKAIFDNMMETWDKEPISLIHGVTGSGKTEIYIKAIDHALSMGKQVLYLLPEIALTTYLIQRLSKYFGNRIGVYHSRFSRNEQEEIFYKVSGDYKLGDDDKRYDIILGSRSSIFLPFHDLGLVVIDEEHDSSYKQFDPSPRYNAKDSAIMLANIYGAKTILGSATPSIETYHNAVTGRYKLYELNKRYYGAKLPKIILSDIRKSRKEGRLHSLFTKELLNEIENALSNKEQVMLFQNRRGFALNLVCETCSAIPECKNCDVSLVYHKNSDLLKCHYCSYSEPLTQACIECGSPMIAMKGFGTQQVEEEIKVYFPKARVERLDLDTTRAKYKYEEIISRFEKRDIDILVGTQMITKGLDFENVSLVGILNADNLIHYPDFRSIEKAYAIITQVSGRAGRGHKQGRVIIQTQNPDHRAMKTIVNKSYQEVYKSQILDREVFRYPPFIRLIRIGLLNRNRNRLEEISQEYNYELRKIFGGRILGPEYPIIARIKNTFTKNFLIKLERTESQSKAKLEIKKLSDRFLSQHSTLRINIDVDPE